MMASFTSGPFYLVGHFVRFTVIMARHHHCIVMFSALYWNTAEVEVLHMR